MGAFSRQRELSAKQKKLNDDGLEAARPETAQETITFKRMFRDGICHVTGKFYTAMMEFEDLNYVLLDEDGQLEILELYAKLINYFDPAFKAEIFLFNRRVDEKELMEMFEISPQEDGVNDVREEFSGMLKRQSAKGKNGVVKSKYVIYGTECMGGVSEARQKLSNVGRDMAQMFRKLGTESHVLDGRERLEVMHSFFNQGSLRRFRFSFADMAGSGKSVKDYVAPTGFDFRYPSRFRMGDMFGTVSYIDIQAAQFDDGLLRKILDIDDNLTVSMHLQTMEPSKAVKMLKGALTNIQKSKIDEQKKAVRAGYDMDILPTDIITYEKESIDLLNDLNSSNQKMIHFTFLITCFGRTKKQMENLLQRVTGIIQQANCEVVNLQYMQEAGLMAASPIGINRTGMQRDLTTKSTAILIPFHTQELFMGAGSLYYGLNALSGNMIMADRKKLRTPNGVILGTPGSGKSFSAKREILGCYLQTRDDILICDPEGEYFPLVKALGGEVVRLSTTSTDYLNPMDIYAGAAGREEALKIKSDFLITLCDAIAGGREGLANDEKGIIDDCIRDVYAAYFENPVPERMPILEDLYNALLHYEPEGMGPEVAIEAKKKAARIANSLALYVRGSQNYFNHRTSINPDNRIVCYDIRDLGKQLKELGMLIVQDQVWNRVGINREKRTATRYYVDEFHLLLRDRQTASYMVEIWKRFRKWGGIPTGLTQNVGDFLKSEEIEGILGNSDFVYLLNQNAKDQLILQDKLLLSDAQLKYVTNSEPGSGLILFDNVVVPFIDRFPAGTKAYAIMTTRPEEAEKRDENGG